ncbi:MAG: protein kinase family protein, partial [Candidatus Xenobia bacterium]
GIARMADTKTQTAMAGAGTPGFSPFEQYGNASTDSRSDIYALGATLWCLLTRALPPNSVDIVAGEATLEPPSRLNDNVPAELDAIIMKMMALRKEDRYQTIQEAGQELLRLRVSPSVS